MKKIFITVFTLVFAFVAWILLSPLFFDTEVNEDIPTANYTVTLPDGVSSDELKDFTISNANGNESPQINVRQRKIASFVNADSSHRGSGNLLLVNQGEKKFLRFEDFSVTNGPDLFVSLNKGNSAKSEHVLLSKLKGSKGNQNYDISEYDLSEYSSVSIYCRAFSVEFATAVFTEDEVETKDFDQTEIGLDIKNLSLEKINLDSVDKRGGTGAATRSYNNDFMHSIELDVADPQAGFFYEGWLVKRNSFPIKFYSTGELKKNDSGNYALDYTAANNEKSKYSKVIVTEETSEYGLDGKPEEHIFDGEFK